MIIQCKLVGALPKAKVYLNNKWLYIFQQISDTENIKFTNRELLTYSIRIAQHYRQWSLKQKDIIGVVSHHSSFATPPIVAAFFNGNAVHTVNPILFEGSTKTYYISVNQPINIVFICRCNCPSLWHYETQDNILWWQRLC